MDFKVNNAVWHLVFTDDDAKLLVNNESKKGVIVYKTATIFIDTRVSLENQLYVLVHELTHLFLYETQIELRSTFTEEQVCEFVAMYSDTINKLAKRLIRRFYKP